MTEYTILTTSEEVNDIYSGNRRFIMRSVHDNMKPGDQINFRLMRNQKEVYHQINRKRYVITIVENWHTAPILKKWLLVGFKEIAND